MYGEKRIELYFHVLAEYEEKGTASTASVKPRIYKLCSLYTLSCQAGKHQQGKNEGRREKKKTKKGQKLCKTI